MGISRTHLAIAAVLTLALSAVTFFIQEVQPPPQQSPQNSNELSQHDECLTSSQIKALSIGEYVRKETLEALPLVKDWSVMRSRVTWELDSVSLTAKGEAIGNASWHEGYPICAQLRGGDLWAKSFDRPPNPPVSWEGPFIYLGPNKNSSEAYFTKLFGGQCFQSDAGEQWCFGDGSIIVGSKQYRASLHLDTSEMPSYGTAVDVKGESKFWIFIPTSDGWRVYQDSWVTEDDHVDIDPGKALPWQVLRLKLAKHSDG